MIKLLLSISKYMYISIGSLALASQKGKPLQCSVLLGRTSAYHSVPATLTWSRQPFMMQSTSEPYSVAQSTCLVQVVEEYHWH